MGKLSEMPRFLVATRLQNLCGKPHQLAKVLRGEDGKEAQIPGTKNALWPAFLDTPGQSMDNYCFSRVALECPTPGQVGCQGLLSVYITMKGN